MNGSVPGLLPATMAHQLNPVHRPGVVDVLDIPGKGKCQVFIARRVLTLLRMDIRCAMNIPEIDYTVELTLYGELTELFNLRWKPVSPSGHDLIDGASVVIFVTLDP